MASGVGAAEATPAAEGVGSVVLGAIDVGSNAIRLAVARVDAQRRMEMLEQVREGVRLGDDVFAGRPLSDETIARALAAFERLRVVLDARQATLVKAVATSALREASNREALIEAVRQRTGIAIEVIGGAEEARLIHRAVVEKVDLRGRLGMLIDVGGGSVEVSLANADGIVASDSFKLGTVRLLKIMESLEPESPRLGRLLEEYAHAASQHIRRAVGARDVEVCVGTGGNLEALVRLRPRVLGLDDGQVLRLHELEGLIDRLQPLSLAERIATLGLKPDRADVIVPAALVLRSILKRAKVRDILVPGVGLKDGLLHELVSRIQGQEDEARRRQVRQAAFALGARLGYDEGHAHTVCRFALALFDATHDLHGLGQGERFLLEIAALLHDVGGFVNVTGHHKHSYYLIRHSDLGGMTEVERELTAQVARYHRKALPALSHEPYRALNEDRRVVVRRLAALLRLANALDVDHEKRIEAVQVRRAGDRAALLLSGADDLVLEQWALAQRADLFEREFGVSIDVWRTGEGTE